MLAKKIKSEIKQTLIGCDSKLFSRFLSGEFDEAIKEHLKYASPVEVACSIIEFNGI